MTTEFKEVPVIDISGLRSSVEEERLKVAKQIAAAAENVGFFYVSGHGVKDEVIAKLKSSAEWLFAQPMEYKMDMYIGNSRCHRGYVPEGEEVFNDAVAPDHKEAFDLGRDLSEDHPLVRARKPFHGPNQWPKDQPEFKKNVQAYYDQVYDVSKILIGGFALALGVDEEVFGKDFNEQLAAFRLIHYPFNDGPQLSQGIGEHTDYECFTILYSDTPGLEVVNSNNEWIPVPPIPGTFVVNIGDTLEILTNSRFVATAHRVRKVPKERYSFPMFVGCNYDTRVAPLSLFIGESAAQHRAVRSGDHVWASVMQTHRYLLNRIKEGEQLPEGTLPLGAYGPTVYKELHQTSI